MQETVLKSALGEYISAKDIHDTMGIEYDRIERWRTSGKVSATKIGAKWYYPTHNIVELVTTN